MASLSSIIRMARYIQYADDLVIYIALSDLLGAINTLSEALTPLKIWLDNHCLTHCHCVIFSKRQIPANPSPVLYNSSPIPYSSTVKHLRLLFDHKLSWHSHIVYLSQRSQQVVNILKYISHTKWGAHPQTMLLIYRALVQSLLDYGPFISPFTNSRSEKLPRIQYSCLRIALGAMRSTPTNALLVESSDQPLILRFSWLASKFLYKLLQLDQNSLLTKLEHLSDSTSRYRNSLPLLLSVYRDCPYSDQEITCFSVQNTPSNICTGNGLKYNH